LCITNELSNADINIKTTGAAANIAFKPGGYLSLEGFTNVTTTFSVQGVATFPNAVSIASAIISSGPQARFPTTLYSNNQTVVATINVANIYSLSPIAGYSAQTPVLISAPYRAASGSSPGSCIIWARLNDSTLIVLASATGQATAHSAGTWYLSEQQIIASTTTRADKWIQHILFSVAGSNSTSSYINGFFVWGWQF
jgi:hypothetical protein